MMKVTFQSSPLTLVGNQLKVGDTAPDFNLTTNDLGAFSLKDTGAGKKLFVVVPSLDTPVCDLEVKKFNEKAASLSGVSVYVVSADLPFAQARWCGAAGVDKVKTLSDYKDRSFGKNYGVFIEELCVLSRAIFVVDENNKVTYVEYVSEITNQPDFDAVYKAL